MSQRTVTQFKALYGSLGSIFPDNTTAEISEGDMRQFGEDQADSFFNLNNHTYSGAKGLYSAITSFTTLKAVVTAGVLFDGVTIIMRDNDNFDQLLIYQLRNSTESEGLPGAVRPDDYNGVTNQKVWKLLKILPKVLYPEVSTIAGLRTIVTGGGNGLPTGTYILFLDTDENILRIYKLKGITIAENYPDIIHPDDYDGVTNPKVWELVYKPSSYLTSSIDSITELKDIETELLAVGATVILRDGDYFDMERTYQLRASVLTETLPDVVRPNDFDGSTNQKVWIALKVLPKFVVPEITTITGLKAITTAGGIGLPVKTLTFFSDSDSGNELRIYRLASGTNAESLPNVVRPDDYDGSTNQKVWILANDNTGLYNDRGNYDASSDTFPSSGGSGTLGAILKGDIWTISVAGTLGVIDVFPGDTVRALIDTPGATAGNWAINAAYTTFAGLTGDVEDNATLVAYIAAQVAWGNLTGAPTDNTDLTDYVAGEIATAVATLESEIDAAVAGLEETISGTGTTTDGTTYVTIATTTISDNGAHLIKGIWLAGKQGSNIATYEGSHRAKRVSGTLALVGSIVNLVTFNTGSDTTLKPSVARINISGDDIQLQVRGIAATTITWSGGFTLKSEI